MEIKTYKALFDIEKQMYYSGFAYGRLIFDYYDGIDIDVYNIKNLDEVEQLKKLNLIAVNKVYHIA